MELNLNQKIYLTWIMAQFVNHVNMEARLIMYKWTKSPIRLIIQK